MNLPVFLLSLLLVFSKHSSCSSQNNIQITETQTRIAYPASSDKPISIPQCTGSFHMNTRAINQAELRQGTLSTSYEFHKQKHNDFKHAFNNPNLAIFDPITSFLSIFEVTPTSVRSIVSSDLSEYLSNLNSNPLEEHTPLIKLFLIEPTTLIILNNNRIYRIEFEKKVKSTALNPIFSFDETKKVVDAVIMNNILIVSLSNRIEVYSKSAKHQTFILQSSSSFLVEAGLEFNRIYTCDATQLLLTVDSKNGVFFYRVTTNGSNTTVKEIYLNIHFPNIVDVKLNHRSIVVVRKVNSKDKKNNTDSLDDQFEIIEYIYNIESNSQYLLKVRQFQRYSIHLETIHMDSNYFYFTSNSGVHYMLLRQRFYDFSAHSQKRIQSVPMLAILGSARSRYNALTSFTFQKEPEQVNSNEQLLPQEFLIGVGLKGISVLEMNNVAPEFEAIDQDIYCSVDMNNCEKWINPEYQVSTREIKAIESQVFFDYCITKISLVADDEIEQAVEGNLQTILRNPFFLYGLIASVIFTIPCLIGIVKKCFELQNGCEKWIRIFQEKQQLADEVRLIEKEKRDIKLKNKNKNKNMSKIKMKQVKQVENQTEPTETTEGNEEEKDIEAAGRLKIAEKKQIEKDTPVQSRKIEDKKVKQKKNETVFVKVAIPVD